MDSHVLIAALVQQTMVLIAQIATHQGAREPLTHVANQVFLGLVQALQDQGMSAKVIADMFGVTLRAYHGKVRRLSESATERGRTLWEAVLSFIEERGPVARIDVLLRFNHDDVVMLRGLLKDLVESGVVYLSGTGDNAVYRVVYDAPVLSARTRPAVYEDLVWVSLYREGPLTAGEIKSRTSLDSEKVDAALDALVQSNRVTACESDADPVYVTSSCIIPLGASHGWEAAVVDHMQAMMRALGSKITMGNNRSSQDDRVGGSTFHFDLTDEHPLTQEVEDLLARVRREVSELWDRVHKLNDKLDVSTTRRVTFYVGQYVVEDNPHQEE